MKLAPVKVHGESVWYFLQNAVDDVLEQFPLGLQRNPTLEQALFSVAADSVSWQRHGASTAKRNVGKEFKIFLQMLQFIFHLPLSRRVFPSGVTTSPPGRRRALRRSQHSMATVGTRSRMHRAPSEDGSCSLLAPEGSLAGVLRRQRVRLPPRGARCW